MSEESPKDAQDTTSGEEPSAPEKKPRKPRKRDADATPSDAEPRARKPRKEKSADGDGDATAKPRARKKKDSESGAKPKKAKSKSADKSKKGDKKKDKPDKGPTTLQSRVRLVLVGAYLLIVALGFFWDFQPRLFWTIGLPLLPLSIVIMGFHNWRRICPLAFWGELGLKAKRGEVQRVPKWLEEKFFYVTFAFLLSMLWFRLMVINGDSLVLSVSLIGLAGAAFLTNAHFTGKTWCNFICPVGMVERIYTEPNSLPGGEANSQCVKCTACKKNCPDIDQENAYWKDIEDAPRRFAYYAFPGLVIAFYTYYYLRVGSWTEGDGAYFNGTWTNQQAGFVEHVFTGQGFFFAPWVPPIVASLLTLVVFSLTSFFVFTQLEKRVISIIKPEAEERRHLTLTIAAFAAFNLFYLWAGAPSILRADGWLQAPWLTRVIAFGIPLLATLFFVKRYKRTRAGYLQEKSAMKMLRKWTFDEPPPKDPAEIFAFFKAHDAAREVQLQAYRETVQEVLADGLVTEDEARLLEQLRAQLGISEKEHKKIFAELSDEQRSLFEADKMSMSIEQRLQLEGYKVALGMVLMRDGSKRELESLRLEYGIEREHHEQLLAELRGESSPMIQRAEHIFDQIDALRVQLSVLAPMAQSGEFAFLSFVLLKKQDSLVDRVVDILALCSDETERVRDLQTQLFAADKESRRAALAEIRALSADEQDKLVDRLEPIILHRKPRGETGRGIGPLRALLFEMFESTNVYERAGAIFAAGNIDDPAFHDAILGAFDDGDTLVRETAVYSALGAQSHIGGPDTFRRLLTDPEPLVAHAAEEVLSAIESGEKREFNVASVAETGRFVAPPVPDSRLSSLATIEKILLLRCVPMFIGLDPEDLHELSTFTTEEKVDDGVAVCEQGDVGEDAYVIVTGVAEVSVLLDGSEVAVAKLGAGNVVGELAAIDGHARSATVRAKDGPVRLLRIPGETFRNRLAIRPDVAPKIMATLSERLRETLSRVRSAA